jgi:hypothetical protein
MLKLFFRLTKWHLKVNFIRLALLMDGIQRDLRGVQTVGHTRLLFLLLPRVYITVKAGVERVFARQGVQVLNGALPHQLHLAADLQVARGVLRVDDQQGRPGVDQQVLALLPLERGVETGELTVVIASHQAGLRLPVRHQRGQHGANGAL